MISLFLQQAATAPVAAEIEDIKGIVMLEPEPSIWATVLWVLLALAIPMAIGGMVWYLLVKFGKGKTMIPPEVKAMQKLKALHQKEETLPPNALSLQISETLKDFLVEKFEDRIRYETADEFLTRFASAPNPPSNVPAPVHQDLKSFVRMSEELKFGHSPDAGKKMASLFQMADNIVYLSKIGPLQNES